MSSLYQKRRKRPELNLVALIDVLVMLIFFAFVTMQFRAATTLNITVPKVQTAGKNAFTGKVEVAVDKDGQLSFNGKIVTAEQLDQLLREVQQRDRDTPVLVRADEITQFKRVIEVWDACRKLGLNKVVMQTRQ